MDNIIDEVAKDPERLREITLMGPLVTVAGKRWPLWVLQATAPSFGMLNALDARGKAIGTMPDHAHPVRVLDLDPVPDKSGWLQPRLMSVHLVVGADDDRYHERGSVANTHKDLDRLLLGWSEDNKEIRASYGDQLRTIVEGSDPSKGQAPFVQVVAEALPHGLGGAGGNAGQSAGDHPTEGDGGIPLPPLRLVAGRVGLYVRTRKAAPWLDRLGIVQPGKDQKDWTQWPRIWLVPDGIEFDAQLPFPGGPAQPPLTGRVLLHAAPQGGKPAFRLKLVEAHDPDRWRDAWSAITPAANQDEALLGLKFAVRRDKELPRFSWTVPFSNDGHPDRLAAGSVDVDGDAFDITLVSPPVLGMVDSTATVRPERVAVTDAGGAMIRYGFSVGDTGAPTMDWTCEPSRLTLGAPQALSLDLDVECLARDLRSAYGIDEPPAVPSAARPGQPCGAAFARPVLPAFVALEDGWLQVSVPNFGPTDVNSDQALATLPAAPVRNVLNGFLRLRQPGMDSTVQSALVPSYPAFGSGAPWSLTIKHAAGLLGEVVFTLDNAGAGGKLARATLKLAASEITTRGLLWVSTDRPNAFEGLPRLSAGPGAFVDVQMRTAGAVATARTAMCADLAGLTVSASRTGRGAAACDLAWTGMSLLFRADDGRWAGELLKPAEARDALREGGICIDDGFTVTLPAASGNGELLADVSQGIGTLLARAEQTAQVVAGIQDTVSNLAKVPPLKAAIKKVDKQLAAARDGNRAIVSATESAADPLQQAHDALPAEPAPVQRPWPGVVWLRHPAIPLAAAMPMTRAAGGSVLPLESRDLMPFVLRDAPAASGKPLVRIAVLAASGHRPLLALADGAGFTLTPVSAWPQQDGAAGTSDGRPVRGIAFAGAGLPGAEFRARRDSAKGHVWEAALRYDLPLLDEAYASASLPPPEQPQDTASPDAAPAGMPTALDWPRLARFWQEQERKHQNSRVADSYLSSFLPVNQSGVPGPAQKVPVPNLVKGMVWSTTLAFDAAPGPLPYGSLTLDGAPPSSGNTALAGYSGKVTPDGGQAALDVLGFSPAAFYLPNIAAPLDNAQSGAGPASLPAGSKLMTRIVWVGGQERKLVSLSEPATAQINGEHFRFWFKDMLFEGDSALLDARDAPVAFNVWHDDATLARSGCEWRFGPANPELARLALELGRNELSFFGLRLEPLRLLDLTLDQGRLASARLLCQLALAPRTEPGNLIVLDLAWAAADAVASVLFSLADNARPLCFTLTAEDKAAPKDEVSMRRVVVTAGVQAKRFALDGKSFGIEIADRLVDLGVPAIDLTQDSRAPLVTIQSPTVQDAAVSSLIVHHASVTVRFGIGGGAASLAWRRSIRLFVEGPPDGGSRLALTWPLVPGKDLTLLGFRASVAPGSLQNHEANGALAATLTGKFGALATVQAGLVARMDEGTVAGIVPLTIGHCEGTVLQGGQPYTGSAQALFGPGIMISAGRLFFSATGKGKAQWTGGVLLDATVDAISDISWPALTATAATDTQVPLPGSRGRPRTGRVKVTASPDSAEHRVTWQLNGHRLQLGMATAVLADADVLWSVPVVAAHVLTCAGKTLAWSAVETIAVGRAASIIPPLPADLGDDPVSFAARYVDKIKDGAFGQPEPGMVRPGLGAAATVFHGALGTALRSMYQPPAQSGLLIAGGFLGLLEPPGQGDATTLLRLPVLAGLGSKLGQTGVATSELAWSDGPAARAVALTRPNAPAPANASYDALAAALLAGSLAPAAGVTEMAEMAGALLVEQSFVLAPDLAQPSLAHSPFFLAAAVSVSAVLDASAGSQRVASLSLVAGRIRRGGDAPIALAAAVAMRGLPPAPPPAARATRLYVVGAALRQAPWTGNRDSALGPYLRALASASDPQPAAVLLTPDGGDGQYIAAGIASLALDSGIPAKPGAPAFRDGRRGWPATPQAPALHWLAAPVEGRVQPVRDAKTDGMAWTGTGLAGLTRSIALATTAGSGQAVAVATETAPASAPALVWLAQSQAPVYLPLAIANLKSGPIGWLQPAPPQVRLPVVDDIASTLLDSLPASGAEAPALQPFMPAGLTSASVGERAGILTVRRIRMLSPLDGPGSAVGAFDAANPRFGAPGQAGSSFALKFRTPRPGPLRANNGDGGRDRRVQASIVRPEVPVRALVGSADVAAGLAGSFGLLAFQCWSIEMAASTETASVVSERWDGSLSLACRIEVRVDRAADQALVPPDAFLFTALGVEPGATQAQLRIGGFVLPFRRVGTPEAPARSAWTVDQDQQDTAVWSATVHLTLDPRLDRFEAQTAASLSDIAQAMARTAEPPPVELQWTVSPGSRRSVLAASTVELNTSSIAGLSVGNDERAPLTLRMPLYPVMQRRGALPLMPCSLVFNDPAYDRDLAGPPATRKVEVQVAAGADPARGRLNMILAADRPRVNCRGVVTLMLDIAYERRLDPLMQAVAEANGVAPAGDVMPDRTLAQAALSMQLIPVHGEARELNLAAPGGTATPANLMLALGVVYELPLALLTEADGKPLQLGPGDVLQLSAKLTTSSVTLWDASHQVISKDNVTVKPDVTPGCVLPLTLTAEPVVEPPPALYLAFQRTPDAQGKIRMAVPLHAQSPLPRRVDLLDPARDFRTGSMRRSATFVWYLISPATMLAANSLTVHKSDRNGQGYWPETVTEFATPERL